MTKKILIAFICILILCVLPLPFISIMRPPPPEEAVPAMVEQELRIFKVYYDTFEIDHGGVAPASDLEIVADGKYLEGVVEPRRTRILDQIEYPITGPMPEDLPVDVIAAYRVDGFGDFYLTSTGKVIERRLPDYDASRYRRIQEEKRKN